MILAVLSVVGGYIPLPEFLEPVFGPEAGHLAETTQHLLIGASVAVALLGLGVAYFFYLVQPGLPWLLAYKAVGIYNLIYNRYYVDEMYEILFVAPTVRISTWAWRVVDVGVIDGLVNGTAATVAANSGLWRLWQSGNVQQYALSILMGAVAILGYFAWR
jgi:NADH-quinone oxidoreductase subunit L